MKINRIAAASALSLAAFSFAAYSCTRAGAGEVCKIESEELLRSSRSWDGVQLPDYPDGKPELRVLKVTVPPHCSLPRHHHDVMSYGVVNRGQLTLVRDSDGLETTVNEGEAVVETVSTVHHGENRGDVPLEIVVFYISTESQPISASDE